MQETVAVIIPAEPPDYYWGVCDPAAEVHFSVLGKSGPRRATYIESEVARVLAPLDSRTIVTTQEPVRQSAHVPRTACEAWRPDDEFVGWLQEEEKRVTVIGTAFKTDTEEAVPVLDAEDLPDLEFGFSAILTPHHHYVTLNFTAEEEERARREVLGDMLYVYGDCVLVACRIHG